MTTATLGLASLWRGFIDAVSDSLGELAHRITRESRIVLTEADTPGRFRVTLQDGDSGRDAGWLTSADGGMTGEALTRIASSAKGSAVDVVISAERVLLRQLPMPAQAGAFLDDIIGNQIDRLAPWPAEEVAFGHAVLAQAGETMNVVVAATRRVDFEPLITSLAVWKPRSITVRTAASADDTLPSIIILRRDTGRLTTRVLRTGVAGILVGAWVLGAIAYGYANWRMSSLDDDYRDVQSRIASRRAASTPADLGRTAELRLVTRKLASTPATLILEDVARLLPDDSYITRFEVAGPVVRLTGLSPDAAGLVGRLENSGLLADVGFFAPTTRNPNGGGEQFHVEARFGRKTAGTP